MTTKVHKRFAEALQQIYPDIDLRRDVEIVDDGTGPKIAKWTLARQVPTEAEIMLALVQVDARPQRTDKDKLLKVLGFSEGQLRSVLQDILGVKS